MSSPVSPHPSRSKEISVSPTVYQALCYAPGVNETVNKTGPVLKEACSLGRGRERERNI